MKSQMKPECYYDVTTIASLDQARWLLHSGDMVTGRVEKILEESEELLVSFGTDVFGYLPFSEATMYPFTFNERMHATLPVQVFTLYHRNVCVKIADIVDEKIILSRKKNMEEAYEYLKNCSIVHMDILSMTVDAIYGDIGCGIYGRVHASEICRSRIRNVSEFFHKRDIIWAAVLSVDDQMRFTLSYKETFPKYDPDSFKPGDVLKCVVNEAVDNEQSGYYATVSPQVTGIVDVYDWMPILHYGDRVECEVWRITSRGLKLRFKRKL